MDFSWIAGQQSVTPADLTVRAQVLSPTDNGRLRWDLFFPRRNVDSVNLDDIAQVDFRPVADRREWNARGRQLTILTPDQRKMSMVPIESYFTMEEQEIQALMERTLGNAATFRGIIAASIPDRANTLAMADYRRLELDAMSAWATGTIIQRNPANPTQTYLASFGFANGRITAAGTAWNDVGVNAYNEFMAWLQAGIDAIGAIDGVQLRTATMNAILADAPLFANGMRMTRNELEARISQATGQAFEFFPNEDTLDVYSGAGPTTVRTKIWPAQKVALIPAGGAVGSTAFAPVVRAMELAASVPGAGIDIRGVTVYYDSANLGRELTMEGQLNAMPVPTEELVWVIDAGV